MKKKLLLIAGLFFFLFVNAELSKTVHVSAGELFAALTKIERDSLTDLTINGTIDSADFAAMRDSMPKLFTLNLTGATLTNNAIPHDAFKPKTWNSETSLRTISFPLTLTSIEQSAFFCCKSLTGNLTLPNNITSLGNKVFAHCTGLNGSLRIPDSVKTIGYEAFNNCIGLSGDLVIPNSVTKIGNCAFFSCTGFNGNLSIPNTITSIGDSIFYDCSGLIGNLNIPNTVKSIGLNAFYGCRNLTGSIIIPDSVSTINEATFYNCNGFTGTLTLPKALTIVKDWAFYGCSGLTALHIKKSTSVLSRCAFYGCFGLKTITVESSTPPIIDGDTFDGVNKSFCKLVVPKNASQAYKNNLLWNEFLDISELTTANTFDIAIETGTGGSVKAGDITLANNMVFTVEEASSTTFTITPNTGFEIAGITFNGSDIKSQITNNQFTTTAIYADAKLSVTFQKIQYRLSIMSAESGSVNLICEYGATPSFDFTPANDWQIHSVLYNNTNVTNSLVDGIYTVPEITENAVLNVSFELITPLKSSASKVKVYAIQSEIIVDGTLPGDMVTLYTINGISLHKVKSQGNRISISTQQGFTYLVKAGSKMVKILL